METQLYSPESLAEKLEVSRSTVYKWVHAGCPTEIKQHKMVRLDYDAVVEWLKARDNNSEHTE